MTTTEKKKELERLNAMHKTIVEMGDEEAYMEWIELIPDCPTEDDMKEIVEDIDLLIEAQKLFYKIIRSYGKRTN